MKIKKIGIDGDEEHIGFNFQVGRISVPKQMKSEKELILAAIIMNTYFNISAKIKGIIPKKIVFLHS